MTPPCSRAERTHPQRELPPELVDRIIDFLHMEPKALAACSLTARSWTAATRYHRFGVAVLGDAMCWEKFDRLIEISPTMARYVRSIVIDPNGAHYQRWISACTSFTRLQHLTLDGVEITPPWQSEAAAISNVAHKITSFTLNLIIIRRQDIWPFVRMFPNLVSFNHGGGYAPIVSVEFPQLCLPCYSPPISSISIKPRVRGVVYSELSNPPYPLHPCQPSISMISTPGENLGS